MKRTSKGFPYRESKKKPTKSPEDRRPHTRKWFSSAILYNNTEEIQQIKIKNIKLWYNFTLQSPIDRNWTKKEAHAIIDMWAIICWGIDSDTYRAMSREIGLFRSLWAKQKGKCAITGLELLGGPGHGRRAIGIDIIKKKKPTKGNVRLVAGPLAYSRWVDKTIRTKTVEIPNPKNYKGYDITFAIVKHIHLAMKADFFKNLPVLVTFPQETMPLFVTSGTPRQSLVIATFSWFTMFPRKAEPTREVTGWESKIIDEEIIFLQISLNDDVLIIRLFEAATKYGTRIGGCSGASGYVDCRPVEKHIKISLSDPSIDVIKEIVKHAKNGIVTSMQRFYKESY